MASLRPDCFPFAGANSGASKRPRPLRGHAVSQFSARRLLDDASCSADYSLAAHCGGTEDLRITASTYARLRTVSDRLDADPSRVSLECRMRRFSVSEGAQDPILASRHVELGLDDFPDFWSTSDEPSFERGHEVAFSEKYRDCELVN